ncbi:hypothetical protein [Actinomycetospora sp. CA-084318]|uniref:hypothetical protein n=1 Tax=Actinomycetospora sp. CA-084318 TaxID=3239892 RepID=UPI003D97C016
MTTAATSTVLEPLGTLATAGLVRLRDGARVVGRRLEEVADTEPVAQHPVLVRALRNVAGLPDRPPHELALGVVTLAIMVATDSIVVDLAANVVAVLFVNHPHAAQVPTPDDAATPGRPA